MKNYCWFCGEEIPTNEAICESCKIIQSGDGYEGRDNE